jgi:hypothetical protein
MHRKSNFRVLQPRPEKGTGKRSVDHQDRHSPPKVVNGKFSPANVMGVKLMKSCRWAADSHGSKIRNRAVPWIMPSGHISGSTLFTWRCSSYQWIATVVRSILQRIKKRAVVSRRSRYKTWHQLTLVAAFYTITNDVFAFERLLNCHRSVFTRLFFHQVQRVDESKRFLLDQTLKGVLWFQLRGNPRVKSTKKSILAKYRNFSVKNFDTAGIRRREADELCDPWIVENRGFTRGGMVLNY